MAAPLSLKTVRLRLSVLAAILLIPLISRAESVTQASTGLSLSITADGRYTIQSADPPMAFAGNVGSFLSDLTAGAGMDNLGSYREIAFHYQNGGLRYASIRIYAEKPLAMFSITYLNAAPNQARFPALTEYPAAMYHLTYQGIFGTHRWGIFAEDSPWIFFDAAANTFILSPASHFTVASTVMGSARDIQSGINSAIPTLPQGFRYDTLLAIGKGVNKAFDTWGGALLSLSGKSRTANDADVVLSRLGYWTDAGASYYYNWDRSLGYTGTLLKVKQELQQQGAPLGYLQLDSWFYPKGSGGKWDSGGGIYRYQADSGFFPNDLRAFQQDLGIPLVTHARWIDTESPYRRQFKMSNNVSTDPLYWETVADYLRTSGAAVYEQDWLGTQAQTMLNLDDEAAYLDNMARSLQQRGINMQYCMAMPSHYLQSTRYGNLTTIRAAEDRFNRNRWDEFLFASRFASALGVWPWSDVFMSGETDNLLVSTLSAGPVGVGDHISDLNGQNLLQAGRRDGMIVKPDVPLAPVDQTFINDAQALGKPMVASTYTNFERSRALYVLAYRRGSDSGVSFTPATLGLDGPVYVYNYFGGSGKLIDAAAGFQDSLDGDRAYYIVAPVGPSGIAFLGDAGHFVSLGKKRVPQLRDGGAVEAIISFAAGESSRMLFGYSPSAPIVTAASGGADVPSYDEQTHLFRVTVTPDYSGSADITISLL